MRLLNPNNLWQAHNLPEGISFHNGIFSGKPTVKGIFDVPVTVSNELGTSTQNIRIITKYRPGTEKYSILQNGEEIDKITIPQLQAMVQNGTAQEKYNCTNTQILLPVYTPEIQYMYLVEPWSEEEYNQYGSYVPHYVKREPSYELVAVNFCSFRNVTLQDGTEKPGLILQFDKPLWSFFAPFDTGDSASSDTFGRWRYSNLRQWLNSSGSNWFKPAYDGDALIDNSVRFPYPTQEDLNHWGEAIKYMAYQPYTCSSCYSDSGIPGFLDFLPEELSAILQPVKVVTQAFFDDNNENESIDDPDLIDGVDADITFDKVFIPSLDEMFICTDFDDEEISQYMPHAHIEGNAWEFYAHRMFTTEGNYGTYSFDPTCLRINIVAHNYKPDTLNFGIRNDFEQLGHSLAYDFDNLLPYQYSKYLKDHEVYGDEADDNWSYPHCFQCLERYPILTRSASMMDSASVWCLVNNNRNNYNWLTAVLNPSKELWGYENYKGIQDEASPVPAFVIC